MNFLFLVFIYICLLVIIIIDIFAFIWLIENIIGTLVKGQAPEIPSGRRLRKVVLDELKNYSASSIVDLGSGFGGMAKSIAKYFPDAQVYGIEFMPFAIIISKLSKLFCHLKNLKFIHGDVFKIINQSQGYDIGVVYLLTPQMKNVQKIRKKFKVLLVLDYPLPDIKPTLVREIFQEKITSFKHRLYIYE